MIFSGLASSLPDGAFVYLATNQAPECVVVDAATHTIVARIPTTGIGIHVNITPDGGTVYQTSLADGTITAIDTATNTVVATVPVGVNLNGVAITRVNEVPDCSNATASPNLVWPPNHKMVQVSIQGVTDPEGDPVSIQIDQTRQDEPTNGTGDGNTCPDAQGVGTATASVRAERNG